ncbi:glycosyltransferase family 4 protein [Candidatus Chloroploca asiatica]|uniref:Glycosyl transferase family 1 n=1 Tax=Candidatus Chloroploca asiatica TaxID=1506545 RepID=A0A2H3KFJ7_9CHLR|nr:glycosyltransferase family 4 protein [Candidatus Chloroploca asiatica]PDV96453.1 glycosyl transferase family 1 [Candidatus Chloroploca asiatica]
MRILALSTWWPEPADNGSRMRIMHLLRHLARTHEVHLLAFTQSDTTEVCADEIAAICASFQAMPRPGRLLTLADRVQSLVVTEPASVRATWSQAFARAVHTTADHIRPDIVLAFEIDVAPYALQLRGVPVVLEQLELGYMLEQFRSYQDVQRRLRYLLTAMKHRRYVAGLLRQLAAVTVVSEGEAKTVRQLAGKHPLELAVIPNGADVTGCRDYTYHPDPDTLIYPGALSYSANLDAMRYFLEAIFPKIRQERPQTLLRITGRTTPEQRAALPNLDGVVLTGYVEDIRALIAQSSIEVVPLREGGGTRLKILEALAVGTPVVSTSKGGEGLALVDGEHLLIADSPDAFARATLQLLEDASARARLSQAGRRAVAVHYDWTVLAQRLEDLLQTIATRGSYRHAVTTG